MFGEYIRSRTTKWCFDYRWTGDEKFLMIHGLPILVVWLLLHPCSLCSGNVLLFLEKKQQIVFQWFRKLLCTSDALSAGVSGSLSLSCTAQHAILH